MERHNRPENKGEEMKFTAVFAFGEKAKFKTVDNNFEKYGISVTEVENADGRGLNYTSAIEGTDVFKYIGFARANKLSGDNVATAIAEVKAKDLVKMRDMMSKPGYAKSCDKLNAQISALRQKERDAHKVAAATTNAAAAQMNNAVTFCNDLASKIDAFSDATANNPKVLAAKQKAEKFIAKNKVLLDSQGYTLAGGQDTTYAPQITVNMQATEQRKSTNINTVIADIKTSIEKELNSSFAKFKDLAKGMLAAASHFDFMIVADGNALCTPANKRNVILDKLTLDDLVNLGPRERLSIYPR
jgi:hypothetical protein